MDRAGPASRRFCAAIIVERQAKRASAGGHNIASNPGRDVRTYAVVHPTFSRGDAAGKPAAFSGRHVTTPAERHRPCHAGSRFSRKLATPSLLSAVPNRTENACRSASKWLVCPRS